MTLLWPSQQLSNWCLAVMSEESGPRKHNVEREGNEGLWRGARHYLSLFGNTMIALHYVKFSSLLLSHAFVIQDYPFIAQPQDFPHFSKGRTTVQQIKETKLTDRENILEGLVGSLPAKTY